MTMALRSPFTHISVARQQPAAGVNEKLMLSALYCCCCAAVVFADDPFKGLLDSSSASSAALNKGSSSSTSRQPKHHLPLDPLTDASAALAANFTAQDVTNLLGVLQNQGLAQELRRSAAEELLALSPEPRLLRVMAEPQNLEAVWKLCAPSW